MRQLTLDQQMEALREAGASLKATVARVFPVPASPLARRTDPATSHQSAAITKATNLGEEQLRALWFVCMYQGRTQLELAEYAKDKDSRRIGKRLSELARADPALVEVHGTKPNPGSNRFANCYWPTEAGRRMVDQAHGGRVWG